MSFLLALVVLILVIVFYVTHALEPVLALLIGLLAVAILLGGYGFVTDLFNRQRA